MKEERLICFSGKSSQGFWGMATLVELATARTPWPRKNGGACHHARRPNSDGCTFALECSKNADARCTNGCKTREYTAKNELPTAKYCWNIWQKAPIAQLDRATDF